jgi:hypothetical protein
MYTVNDWKTILRRFTGMTEDDVNDYGIALVNEGRIKLLKEIDSYITEDTYEADTIATQQDYQLPIRCHKIEDVSVYVSNIRYSPRIITNVREWNLITSQNTVTGTIPIAVYVDKNRMSFFPIPSANGNEIRAVFTAIEPDLTESDATGGTITATNGSATITGVGTTFAASNVGWKIKLPDNFWYEVESVASATSLTISKLYEGATASGATYRLGQVSIIPEGFQLLPVYYGAMTHYLMLEKPEKAAPFKRLWDEGRIEAKAMYGNKIKPTLLTGSERRKRFRDPNDYLAQGIT